MHTVHSVWLGVIFLPIQKNPQLEPTNLIVTDNRYICRIHLVVLFLSYTVSTVGVREEVAMVRPQLEHHGATSGSALH